MHRSAGSWSARLASLAVVATLVVAALGPVAPAGAEQQIAFDGGGWGHGIGMSQWGARGFAANGRTAEQILTHYYQGTTISAAASPNPVRIGLLHDKSTLSGSTTQGGSAWCDASEYKVALPAGGWSYHPVGDGQGGFYGQLRRSDGAVAVNCNGRTNFSYLPGVLTVNGAHTYRHGTLELTVRPGTSLVRAVANIYAEGDNPAIDVYLYGLGEMPSSWPMEALRSQAIAGRTYALEKINRLGQHRTSPPCDCALVSTVFDQNYVGYAKESGASGSSWVQAVQSSRSLAVKHNGALIQAYYSSSSGGATENNELVWGGTGLPYLRGVSDPYDGTGGNPNHRWSVTFSWSALQGKLNGASDTAVGTLQSIQIVSPLGPSGRVIPVQSDGSGGVRITGSSGTKRVSGDRLRSVLGLKSTLFSITDVAPADAKTVPAGGYTLRADGGLVPFGGAPAATGAPSLPNTARAVALGGPTGRRGYVLDGFGNLHAINGAPARTGFTWGTDIARDLALRSDGQSGYVVEGFGGIQPFGGAEPIPPETITFYQGGSDVVRRIALRRDGRSGYVLTTSGGVHPFGGAPAVSTTPLGAAAAVGLLLRPDGTSGYVVDANGELRGFGAGALPPAVSGSLAGTVGADHRPDGASGYAASGTGAVAAFGGAFAASPASTGGSSRRDIALVRSPAGYVLDGFGGLHPFGGAAPASVSGYWSGWDIARRVAVRPDGAGFVMDAYGGLHPFTVGGVPLPARPSGGPWWQGWEIARDLVLLPGSASAGYVLDGFGGLHPFGGAPAASVSGYWSGWDIARRVVIRPDGTGGYVLDGFGGLHPFAIGDDMPPALAVSGYWSGWDIARDVVLTGNASGYTFDGFGGAHGFGGASGGGSWWWDGHDLVIGAASDPANPTWVVYADGWGGVHTAPAAAPAVDGTSSWPGWNIGRDVATTPPG